MKSPCIVLAVAALATPALAGTDIGVSVGISQPGFYGRIDTGSVSMAPVPIYAQPVLFAAPRAVVVQTPVYLRVPPGHARKWRKQCAHYGACAQPVYFVQEDWYSKHYAVRHEHARNKGRGRDNDD